jgi:hypothetical protein
VLDHVDEQRFLLRIECGREVADARTAAPATDARRTRAGRITG